MKTMLDQISISVTSQSITNVSSDVLIVPLFLGEKLSPELKKLDESLGGEITDWSQRAFIKEEREKFTWIDQKTKSIKASSILLVNLGKKSSWKSEDGRNLFGSVSKYTNSRFYKKVSLLNPGIDKLPFDLCVEGFLLGSYRFSRYQAEKSLQSYLQKLEVVCVQSDQEKKLKAELERVKIHVQATFMARDLVNEPGNVIYPDSFAKIAKKMAKDTGISVQVLKGDALKKEKMDLLMAVGHGSANEPCLVHLEYKPSKKAKHKVVLVGKGVTFDSGGLSLKPPTGMITMKTDMGGSAAVFAAIWAAAKQKLPVHVHVLMPLAENMPSDRATRPGDVVKGRSGKTVEIDNTDAEGRLILADALSYGDELGADYMIDVATLTGAVIIALGDELTALFSSDKKLQNLLQEASSKADEGIWPLPLEKNYMSQLKSEVADMKNTGGRAGGSITAALFLQEFVSKTKWAHLDIAGSSRANKDYPTCPVGGTGSPVRSLVRFLESL